MTGDDVTGIAAALLDKAGIAHQPVSFDRLAGGRNNRVYRLNFADRPPLVLKSYHWDPNDTRDRLGAEWQFLRRAWDLGIRAIPQPLCADESLHSALYPFIEGRRAEPAGADLVDQALDLVLALNAADAEISLRPASEACFSVDEHVSTIDRRVGLLASLDAGNIHAGDAGELVGAVLRPKWAFVRQSLLNAAAERGTDIHARIEREVVSPSDFGFHNALIDTAGRAIFIDFEYAGRDDPAKLVCDFFCQPEVPVPGEFFAGFVARLSGALGLSEEDEWRCGALLDAYRIKWACIMLNEFTVMGAKRRAFSNPDDAEARARHQIERVRGVLAQIRSTR